MSPYAWTPHLYLVQGGRQKLSNRHTTRTLGLPLLAEKKPEEKKEKEKNAFIKANTSAFVCRPKVLQAE